jgi:acyl-CoA hydrolase
VVTEFGAADLRGCSHDARAERLIAIAAPAHREMLKAAWDAASS